MGYLPLVTYQRLTIIGNLLGVTYHEEPIMVYLPLITYQGLPNMGNLPWATYSNGTRLPEPWVLEPKQRKQVHHVTLSYGRLKTWARMDPWGTLNTD